MPPVKRSGRRTQPAQNGSDDRPMWQAIGIGGVFATICIGYTLGGGHFGVIIASMGPELISIGGAGAMTMLISNDIGTVKKVLGGLKKIFSGPCWRRQDYADALCLMFLLVRVARAEGNLALERHIEKPAESPIFAGYPRLLADKDLVAFIADVFRTVMLNCTDPHKVGEMMESEIEKRQHEALKAPKALATVSDGLPALGIVAAVLGVIKAMGAISSSPDVLGHMIGSALVGTFLGVFLSYGLVGPIAGRVKGIVEEERSMLALVREIIIAHLETLGPQLAVEIGRRTIPSKFQPSYDEVDGLLKQAGEALRGAARKEAA
jgi:chemotaxis protein MotA